MKTKVEIISIVIILMLSMISTNLFLTSVKAQDPQPLYIELDEEWSSNAYYEKEGVEYFAESIGVKAYLMSKPPGKWEYCFRVEGTCAINKSLDHWYTSGMAIIKSNNLKHEGNPYYTQAYNYTAMDTDSVDDGEIIPVIDLARTALISDPIIATFVQLSISAGQIAENMKDTSADGWTIPAFPGEEDLHKEGFGVAWYDLTVDANKEFTVTFDLSTSIFANVEGGYIYNINSLDGDDEHVHGNGRISITLTSPPPADLVAKKVYISSEPKNENKEIDNSNAINFEGEEVYLNFKYKNTDVEPAPSHDVSLKLNEIENTDRVTGLQGGQTKTISFPWVLEQKSFSLEGEVDVNDEVGFNYNQDNDVKEREYLFDWTEPEVQITKPEKNGFYFNGRKLFEFPDSLPWDALLIFGNLDAKVSAVDNVGMAEVWFRLSNDNNVYDYTDYKSPWKWSNCFRNGKWDLMACACDLSGLCMDDYLYDILCIYLIESKSILSPKDNNDGKSFEWNFQTKITNSNDILNTINLMNEDILTEIRYTYIFDFGDGESISFENVTDTSKNVNHEYEEEKIYNTLINLIATIKIDLNVDGEFQSDEIFIKHYLKNYQLNVGHIEQIDVNANGPYLASIGETIQFNATVEGGTPPYNWIWDFGDGNTMQDIQNPVYSFEKQGVYDVLVQVEDANGYKQKDVTKAIISGVELSVAPNPSIPGQEITFKANLGNINFTNEPYYIFNILDQNIGTVNDNITHIYEEPGIYIESVTVYDGENGEIVAYDTVTVYINSFEIDAGGPYAGFDGEPVFFEGSMISDAQLFMVEWDFGDGNTSSSLQTSHIYNTDGQNRTYTATLTVTTPGNEPAIDIAEVKIWNISNYEPPHAVINGVSCGEPNDVIPLDGGQSDGRIRTFLWKVDDEPWVDSGPVFSQEYPAKEGESPYLYKIQLKVIDEFGFTDTTTHNVVIKEARADFRTNEPMTDISPVYFNDLSIPQGCNDIDSWFWEFGDGDFSREENPQHQYSDDGYYAVKLQITSAEVADEITKIIHVENVPPAADFDAKPLVTVVGDFITCNSSSYDCDGKIMSWETDFGDGEKAYIDNSTHNYSESGFYTLKMRVIDDDFDEDLLIKKDHILVADTMVSNDFDSTSNGWNVTHFNDIQKAVDATPRNGILVILDGSYNTGNILVTKPMKIYAIQKGDLPYDYEIEYGGATISYESFVPIFDIATSDIEIRGLTIADGSCGVKSFGDNITLNYCDFIGNEKAIDSISTSNLTIYHCNINSNNIGINLENSEYCFINNCKFNENKYGIKLIDNSNENTISQCIVNNTVNTAILIDESKYNRIESCEIHNSIIGIKINDVSSDVVGENKIKQGKMLNVIENTNFTLTDYGVYIENSSLTRVGTERWSFCGLEGLYPVYYHDSVAGSPVIPRPSNLDEASSLFIDNEFPIFINNSNNNVIDGIAVTEGITSSIGISISSENGVYINNSNGNVIISCLIQHAKHSAINMSYSHENTVCLCMCKENSYGIDIENCYNNLFIACSFFNNTYYGIQMDYCSGVNNVQYNDFINNNLDDSNSQAYDSGEGNNWDDNGHSIWRDLIRENNHEITDNNSKIIGNFWSDYTGGCIENGTGQVPANSDMIDWVPVGITPYYISGLANSRDNGPVLHTIWPYMWYNTDNGGEGYNLPPIPLP